jgi:hypothetical protein
VRVFTRGWTKQAAAFRPGAVAATPAQLDELAISGIESQSHAVIALTRPGEPRLSEARRERFWSAFRVPVFEQIIGQRGRLVAAECEAHDGLHLQPAARPPDNAPGQMKIDASPCPCGRKTPRLVPADSRETLRRAATYAR